MPVSTGAAQAIEDGPSEPAGGPHEVAGNGGPRWMVVPRAEWRVDRTRLTGQLARPMALTATGAAAWSPRTAMLSEGPIQRESPSHDGEITAGASGGIRSGTGLVGPVRAASLPGLALGGPKRTEVFESRLVDLVGLDLLGGFAHLGCSCLPVTQGLVF